MPLLSAYDVPGRIRAACPHATLWFHAWTHHALIDGKVPSTRQLPLPWHQSRHTVCLMHAIMFPSDLPACKDNSRQRCLSWVRMQVQSPFQACSSGELPAGSHLSHECAYMCRVPVGGCSPEERFHRKPASLMDLHAHAGPLPWQLIRRGTLLGARTSHAFACTCRILPGAAHQKERLHWERAVCNLQGLWACCICCISLSHRFACMCRAPAGAAHQKSDSTGSAQSATSKASGPAASAASASTSVPPGFPPSLAQTVNGAASAQASLPLSPLKLSASVQNAWSTHRCARSC